MASVVDLVRGIEILHRMRLEILPKCLRRAVDLQLVLLHLLVDRSAEPVLPVAAPPAWEGRLLESPLVLLQHALAGPFDCPPILLLPSLIVSYSLCP